VQLPGPRLFLRIALLVVPALAGLAYLLATQAEVVARGRFDPNTGTVVERVEVFDRFHFYASTSGFFDADVLTGVALASASAVALVVALLLDSAAASLDRLRWFFSLAWLGTGFLAADELFSLHETIGHNLQFLGDFVGRGNPDDAVLAVYALPTAAFVYAFRDVLTSSRRATWLLAGGLAAYVLAVLADVTGIEREDFLEVLGALLVAVSFVALALDRLVARAR
jgi:hypothetical protein